MVWYILSGVVIIVAVIVAIIIKKKNKPVIPVPVPKPEPEINALWKNSRIVSCPIEGIKLIDEPINVTGDTTEVEITVEGDKDAVVITPQNGVNLQKTTIEMLPNEGDNARTVILTISKKK